MKIKVWGLKIILLIVFFVRTLIVPATEPVDFVNTIIGVIDNRTNNCVIGPMMPYGSINPSPQTLRDPKIDMADTMVTTHVSLLLGLDSCM